MANKHRTLCEKGREIEKERERKKKIEWTQDMSRSQKFFTSPVLVARFAKLDGIIIKARHGTYYPSGRYLLMIRGIFFWLSSLIAIWSGSVSPSRSTRTGAFILCQLVSILLQLIENKFFPNLI